MTMTNDFSEMGLSPETLASVRKMGFTVATSIQA